MHLKRRQFTIIVAVSLSLFISRQSLFGQVDTGTITGTVLDAEEAVLPGIAVTFKQQLTGFTTSATTNASGVYVSPPLRPGPYEVSAEAPGFQKIIAKFTLEINQRAVLNLKLEIGKATQSVEVVAETPLLERETSSIGNVRSERQIKELPLNLRVPTKLFELAAGTVPVNTQAQSLPITQTRGATMVSVNGVAGQLNNILIDGINNMENHNGTGMIAYPPLDALEEFKVQTSVSDAEFGRAAGGVVNLKMKSGGRQVHGDVFEFLRNSALDAKNFFDPRDKPQHFISNQFGATLGGPVMIPHLYNTSKEKTFFFLAYEGIRRTQTVSFLSTVPTPDMLNGNFSSLPTKIYNPLTTRLNSSGAGYVRDPFPGNIIPASQIQATSQKLGKFYPAPNLPGLTNNFIYVPSRILNSNTGDVKIDHYATQKDILVFRFDRGATEADEPSSLPSPAIGAGPGFPGHYHQPSLQGEIGYTRIISPSFVNEFRVGESRFTQISRQLDYGQYIANELGIPGINVVGDPSTSGNVSSVSIPGYSSLGDGTYLPATVVSDNSQIGNNISMVRGSHSFKFGGEIHRIRYNAGQSPTPRGSIAFQRAYTTDPSSASGTGDGIAELLLGAPQSGTLQLMNGTRGLRRWEYNLYFQDTYKVNQRLSLNLGLRYDIYAHWPYTEVADRMAQFRVDKGMVYPIGSPDVPSGSGTNTDYKNLSPRIGVAYNVNSKTVLRTAYGLFYAPSTWDVSSNLASNPPFVGRITYSNDQFNYAAARKLSDGFDRPSTFPVLGASLNATPLQPQTPYVQQWNFNIERQLPANVLFTAAYVGTKGTHLFYTRNINLPVPGSSAVAGRRLFPQYSDINFFAPEADSSYNSLQLTAERRFAGGLSFLGAYTWSHCIDDIGVQNPLNRRADRGNCDLDLRQRFVASYNYELPIGRGKRVFSGVNSVVNGFIGNWQMNGILNVYAGFPFTPSSGINTLNSPGSSQRANLLPNCDPTLSGSTRTVTHYFNTACFAIPTAFTFGNAGRNILTGPGTSQFDFSLFKNFPITESRYVQFRAEFYNITNTPQFNNPNAAIGTGPAGSISSAGSVLTFSRAQRQIQLALKVMF